MLLVEATESPGRRNIQLRYSIGRLRQRGIQKRWWRNLEQQISSSNADHTRIFGTVMIGLNDANLVIGLRKLGYRIDICKHINASV